MNTYFHFLLLLDANFAEVVEIHRRDNKGSATRYRLGMAKDGLAMQGDRASSDISLIHLYIFPISPQYVAAHCYSYNLVVQSIDSVPLFDTDVIGHLPSS